MIYVLLLIVVLSSVMVHQAYLRKIKGDRRAFEFTVAQIQNILNLANAYRLDQGHWPRNNQSGACESLEDFVSQIDVANNGWGFKIVAEGNCDLNNSNYTISQLIPQDYYSRFEEILSDNVSNHTGGNPTGYTRMTISIDRASVVGDKIMDIKRFSSGNPTGGPGPYFDYLVCDLGTSPKYIAGLSGQCADIKVQNLWPLVGSDPIIRGSDIYFETTMWGPQVEYDIVIDNEQIWPLHSDDSPGDDLRFASKDCPTSGGGAARRIKALFLAWCE